MSINNNLREGVKKCDECGQPLEGYFLPTCHDCLTTAWIKANEEEEA